jgi:hypothetical protein
MSFQPRRVSHPEVFALAVLQLRELGHADADIEWSEHCAPPTSAAQFAREAIFVICNSGMKNTVARQIYARVCDAIGRNDNALTVFRHIGKAAAIDQIWFHRERHFAEYLAAEDKVTYCETLPWIGGITKYHLAKNFGAQVAKPDVHLQRLADLEGITPQALCEALALDSGYKVATVDVLLWRACATGVVDSRTGLLREPI